MKIPGVSIVTSVTTFAVRRGDPQNSDGQHQVGAQGRGRAMQEDLRYLKEQLREQLDISSILEWEPQ